MLLLLSGIPLGILIIAFGASLFFYTRYEKIGEIIVELGNKITILTFVLILLAYVARI